MMNSRTSIRMIAMMAVILPMGWLAAASGQESPKKTAPAKSEPAPALETQIYALKNANATSLAQVISASFAKGKSDGRVVAEPRTNSIVVVATATDMAMIRDLIQQFDRPAPNEDLARQRLAILPLRTVVPDHSFEVALNFILEGSNYTVDRARRSVIINANDEVKGMVEALINRLDAESTPRSSQDVQIRVVWLINDGPGENQQSPPPPEDMKDVLPALAKMGVTKPGLAAQLLVTATADQEFRVHGNANVWNRADSIRFSATGHYSETKTGPELKLAMRGVWKQDDNSEAFNLESTISAPLGQLIVLGMAPYERSTSVFVVQVLAKQGKPAPKK